jgi:ArsR family transcriptional regulator
MSEYTDIGIHQKKLLQRCLLMANCGGPLPGQRILDLSRLESEESQHLALVANAMSDPIRVQMVHFLEQQGDLCTCELMQLLGLAQSKASYHLRVLLEAGLVTRRTLGTWSYYTLKGEGVLARLRTLAADSTGSETP